MSHLQNLLLQAKEGLQPWERIPDAREELATIEEWDGDTQDDIHLAISFFSKLADLVENAL